MSQEILLTLSPDDIIIKENIRYNLKPYAIDHLAEQIAADGGVNTPVEVQETEEGYVLTCGHQRVEAVKKLNSQGAGLMIPARVMPIESEAQRVLRQVSENNDRENLSPMDKSIAMQRMLAVGLSKMDVRKAFAVAGGRKGQKFQPASNSHVNQVISLLELPKPVQNRIHDGLIPASEAYALAKIPADKRQAVLDRIEADRIKDIDKADKEEEKFLKDEKELTEKTQEAEALTAEHAVVVETAKSAASVVEEKEKEFLSATQATLVKGQSKEDKAAAQERLKSAIAELKSANDAATKTAKEAAKLSEKVETASEKAAAAKARLEEARKAKLAKKSAPAAPDKAAGKVKSGAVKKAAAKEGVGDKPVKLNAGEMRDAIKTLILNGKAKTKAAGQLITDCFDGEITDGQLELGIARLLGEAPMPAAAPAKK